MGNFCNSHHLDASLTPYQEEVPLNEMLASFSPHAKIGDLFDFVDGTSTGNEALRGDRTSHMAHAIDRATYMRSCMQVQTGRFMEIEVEEDGQSRHAAAPTCIGVMTGESAEDEEELDFSKDRYMHDKRPPAVFMGRDALTGEAKYTMPSPSRSGKKATFTTGTPEAKVADIATPARSTNSPTKARSGPSTPREGPPRRNAPTGSSKPVSRADSCSVAVSTHQQSSSSQGPPGSHQVSRSRSAPPTSRNHCPQSSASAVALIEDLNLETGTTPDFSLPPMREKLCRALGTNAQTRVERMGGFQGGQNGGLWMLHDGVRAYVLKLIPAQRRHRSLPTDAEQFRALLSQYPGVRTDSSLAFPVKIFLCYDSRGNRQHDLVALPRAPGRCLSEVIALLWTKGDAQELLELFYFLGEFLARFHSRYKTSHGDFQPSNIFYDEESCHFTLIDIGGMALASAGGVTEDIRHFGEALHMLARGLRAEFFNDAFFNFQAGYAAHRC